MRSKESTRLQCGPRRRAGLRALVLVVLLACIAPATFAKTVVIDAGHGGHDRGGVPGQRVPEKTMTLDVAQRLEKKLRARGYRTVMTRRSDVFVSLGGRCAIANGQRNAIFVSVHFNSGQRVAAEGFETFYYGSASSSLAARIQSKLLRIYRTEDRGVKRRGFYVLRRTRIPAVLVECGFLTNPSEARRIMQSSHRDALAEAIASAISEKF